jgi:hypothetical protein
MDYGSILSRAWNIIWTHKFLIVLGLLVALGSGVGSGTSSGINYSFDREGGDFQFGPMPPDVFGDPGFAGPQMPVGLIVVLFLLALAVAVVVWAISTIARGGLISGVGTIDSGGTSSFGQAWAAGWRRGWTLLGIGIVPALPGLLLLVLAGLGVIGYTVSAGTMGYPRMGLAAIVGIVACIAVPVALVLELLRTFANRACMLEGLGVVDSYRRGLGVLGENLGSALVLFLIQVALLILMGILLFVPGALLALCCLFWPVLLLFQGAVAAFFSTVWTLAWREWTGESMPEAVVAS